VRNLTGLLLCLVLGSVLVSAQITETDVREMIARVKTTRVSELDTALSPVMPEKWLSLRAGGDAVISWAVREGTSPADDRKYGLPLVEADLFISGRPSAVIMISTGTSEKKITGKPSFSSGEIIKGSEWIDMDRLSDFSAGPKGIHHLEIH